MADIVTGTVTGQVDNSALLQDHADIRRETAMGMADGRYATATGIGDARREAAEIGAAGSYQNAMQHAGIVDSVKTSAWANSDRTGSEADRVVQQDTAYFIASQSQNFANSTAIAALKSSTDASTAATLAAIQLTASQATAATALEGAKSAAAAALGQALLGQAIVADGNSTRALINGLKIDDLNRALVERNTEAVELRSDERYSRLVGQMNMIHSQVQDTRAGLVNFGTMAAGAGTQTSTSNIAA